MSNKLEVVKEFGMGVEDIISKYRQNGYIFEMRKQVGHDPIMVTACGVIIENEQGEILLQRRRDNGLWGLPGGSMEPGEKFEETVKREVFEEAGIEIGELKLFGIYSGKDRIITYPNGDICCVTGIVFKTSFYTGQIENNTSEAIEYQFFDKTYPESLRAGHMLPCSFYTLRAIRHL